MAYGYLGSFRWRLLDLRLQFISLDLILNSGLDGMQTQA